MKASRSSRAMNIMKNYFAPVGTWRDGHVLSGEGGLTLGRMSS